ncbi:hypothetical protein ACIP1T_23800 [Pseudomonas japonica]|uniref:hypothetical protein n=1 Tax=Pseudomonas japonica TaxID=256466 RepID=UPI0037F2C029
MYEDLMEVHPPYVQMMVAKYTGQNLPGFSQTLKAAGLTASQIRDLLNDFKSKYSVTLTVEEVENATLDEIIKLLKKRTS